MPVLGRFRPSPPPRPVSVELHYSNGYGYWARVNGEDAGLYSSDWREFALMLGEQLSGANLLHPTEAPDAR